MNETVDKRQMQSTYSPFLFSGFHFAEVADLIFSQYSWDLNTAENH